MPDDALGPRSLLRGADGKGLLPLIPARLADAIIALAEAFTRSQQACYGFDTRSNVGLVAVCPTRHRSLAGG